MPKVLWISGGFCSLGIGYGMTQRSRHRQNGLEIINKDSSIYLNTAKILPHVSAPPTKINYSGQQWNINTGNVMGTVAAGGIGLMFLAVKDSEVKSPKVIEHSSFRNMDDTVSTKDLSKKISELIRVLSKICLQDGKFTFIKKSGAILMLNLIISVMQKIPFGGQLASQNVGSWDLSYELLK